MVVMTLLMIVAFIFGEGGGCKCTVLGINSAHWVFRRSAFGASDPPPPSLFEFRGA